MVKEVQDLSCALFDRDGRVIVQSKHAPMLLAGSTLTMQEALKALGGRRLAKGDVIIANDPFRGGQHIMGVMMIGPVYRPVGPGDGELVGYVGSVAHRSDLGGASPGGVAGGLTEIYAEGLCFPFVRLYIGGRENEDLFALIANNIRVPRSEEHTSELQSPDHLVCRLLLEKKNTLNNLPFGTCYLGYSHEPFTR